MVYSCPAVQWRNLDPCNLFCGLPFARLLLLLLLLGLLLSLADLLTLWREWRRQQQRL